MKQLSQMVMRRRLIKVCIWNKEIHIILQFLEILAFQIQTINLKLKNKTMGYYCENETQLDNIF